MNEVEKNLWTAYEWISQSKCCGETDESGKCSINCSLVVAASAILDGIHELQLMQQALKKANDRKRDSLSKNNKDDPFKPVSCSRFGSPIA